MSLVACGGPGGGEPTPVNAVYELLRGCVGEGVTVTTGKAGVFLYAATADAAAVAEGMAREALARQGLAADVRLDRWDPSRQAWETPGDAAAAGLPPEQESNPGRKPLRTAGALIAAIIEGIASALKPGSATPALWRMVTLRLIRLPRASRRRS